MTGVQTCALPISLSPPTSPFSPLFPRIHNPTQPQRDIRRVNRLIKHPDNHHFQGVVRQFLHFEDLGNIISAISPMSLTLGAFDLSVFPLSLTLSPSLTLSLPSFPLYSSPLSPSPYSTSLSPPSSLYLPLSPLLTLHFPLSFLR